TRHAAPPAGGLRRRRAGCQLALGQGLDLGVERELDARALHRRVGHSGAKKLATARVPLDSDAERLAANLLVEAALESRQPLGVGADEPEDVRGELTVRIHPARPAQLTHPANPELPA